MTMHMTKKCMMKIENDDVNDIEKKKTKKIKSKAMILNMIFKQIMMNT
jgi:hypothetical protein